MTLSRVDGILLYFIVFTGRHCSPIYALIFIESSTCTEGLNKYFKMEFFLASFLYANLTLFYYKRYLRSLITKIFDSLNLHISKVLMQGKLFQRGAHYFYCSVLSLGGKVNTRRMSETDMESIFTKKSYEIFWL